MSWFSRGSRREKESAGKTGTLQVENELEVHRSLALPFLFDAMKKGDKRTVLDLGSAIGSNVERLSEYGSKLFIEDLFASRASAGEGEILGPEFFEQLVSPPAGTGFDVVLAWDLFNYLQRKELALLAAQIRRHCRPGALVFALLWIHKTIPAQPIRFRFQDQDKLVYERRTALERPGPRFAPAELNSSFQGFRVDRSFLLRHGIQEYLFIRE